MMQRARMLKMTPEAILKLEMQARQTQRRKCLGALTTSQRFKLRDESKKLHLVDRHGHVRGLISLRCANQDCKLKHPDSPASIEWFKVQLQKGMLRCPACKGKNFVRTETAKPQGELMAEIIDSKTKHIKRQVEDEVGDVKEGKYYEKKFGVKIK